MGDRHSQKSYPSYECNNTRNKSWFCESLDSQTAKAPTIECCSEKKQKKEKCKKCCQNEQRKTAPRHSPSLCQNQSPLERSPSYMTTQTCQKPPERQCICSRPPCSRNQDATGSRNPCVKVTVSTTGKHLTQIQFPEEKNTQSELGEQFHSEQLFMRGQIQPGQFTQGGQILQPKFTSGTQTPQGLTSQGVQTQPSQFTAREQTPECQFSSATETPPGLFSQSTQTPSSNFASYSQG